MTPVVVEVRVDRGARVAGVAEQQDRAEQVVEPAAGAADHEDARRLEGDCRVERELEVGRVLGRRVPLDRALPPLRPPRALPSRPSRSRRSPDRCEAPARAPGRRPSRPRSRVHPPAARARGQGRDALRQRRRRSRASTRIPPLALPRSGSAGRRRVEPPSQPGRARAPRFAAAILACRGVSRTASRAARAPRRSRGYRLWPRRSRARSQLPRAPRRLADEGERAGVPLVCPRLALVHVDRRGELDGAGREALALGVELAAPRAGTPRARRRR